MADIGTKNILWGGLLFLTWLIFNVNDYKIVGTLCSRVQSTICSYHEEPPCDGFGLCWENGNKWSARGSPQTTLGCFRQSIGN